MEDKDRSASQRPVSKSDNVVMCSVKEVRTVRRRLRMPCNLCHKYFYGETRFERFCSNCRHSTLYKSEGVI